MTSQYTVLLVLAVACGVATSTEDMENSGNASPTIHRTIAGIDGDYTITVNGGVQWKETITVQKANKSANSKMQEDNELEKYHIRATFALSLQSDAAGSITTVSDGQKHVMMKCSPCCLTHSNKTDNKSMAIIRQCVEDAQSTFGDLHKRSDRLNIFNCLIQCVCRNLGLSDSKGNILAEEMATFVASDVREVTLGISKDMVSRCVRTAKLRNPDIDTPSKGGHMCNTSNLEVVEFLKCMTELENLHCPDSDRIHSKACFRSKMAMRKGFRGKHWKKY